MQGITLFNPPGFEEEALGRIKELLMQYNLWALLRGKLHFRQIKAEISEVNIITNKEGRSNVAAFKKKPPKKEDIKLAQEALTLAEEIVKRGEHDIIILDEINIAMNLNLIEIERVLELIKNKPEQVEFVLTGRNAPQAIIEKADLVTEMREVKHPYTKGRQARKGIEY